MPDGENQTFKGSYSKCVHVWEKENGRNIIAEKYGMYCNSTQFSLTGLRMKTVHRLKKQVRYINKIYLANSTVAF